MAKSSGPSTEKAKAWSDPKRPYKTWTRERIETAIREISEVMKGPMDDMERRCHYLDRKDLREELSLRSVE